MSDNARIPFSSSVRKSVGVQPVRYRLGTPAGKILVENPFYYCRFIRQKDERPVHKAVTEQLSAPWSALLEIPFDAPFLILARRKAFDAEPESKERALQNDRFKTDAAIWEKLRRDLPHNFGSAIQLILDEKGISQNELAMRIGVCRASVRKWCSERVTLRHVVALCIALDVRADIGEQLVVVAGLFFRRNSEDELLHALLFETKDLNVARANEIMEQAGLPKLTYGEGDLKERRSPSLK